HHPASSSFPTRRSSDLRCDPRRDRWTFRGRGPRSSPSSHARVTVFAGTPVLPENRLWLWRIGFPIVRALGAFLAPWRLEGGENIDRKSTRLNSSHVAIS